MSLRSKLLSRSTLTTITALSFALAYAGCGGSTAPPAITVSLSPSAAQAIDQGQTLGISAAVANDSSNKGVTWSVSGGGTLSSQVGASVTYTAPATVTAATAVTVTATSAASTSASASVAITVNPDPAVTTAGALPAATTNTAYSAALAASGGSGALSWALANGSSLPTGLTLSKSGVISGTVAAPTSASFTVTVTDSSAGGAQSATSGTLTLAVNPAPLTVTAPALANAVQGTAYTSAAFTSTGGTGAITWSATGLPAGLSIGSNGVISGTASTAGAYANIVVTATDSGSGTYQQTKSTAALSITVYPTLSVGSLAAVSAVQNVTAVNATATSSGGSGAITWSATNLPAGVVIAASTGVISGTPTASGTFSVTVTAADSGTPQQSVSTTWALTVIARLAITTPTLAHAVQGTAYTSAAFTAAGGTTPITWSATGLPAGLAIGASTGVISGTPTGSGASANVVVTATDAGAGALNQTQSTSALTLTVIPTLALTSTTLPSGTDGTPYTATTLAASGGVTPYTWSATGLPAGLTLNASTGVLSGTPQATNAGTVSLTVTDAGTPQQTQSASLTLTVNAGTPVITTTSVAAATVNVAYSQTLGYNAEGQTGTPAWAYTGTLPAGLSLNASTGVISGTPTATGSATITVTVTVGGVTSAGQPLSLSVLSVLTVTSSATPPNATVGSAYSFALQAAGGSGSGYSWSLASGTLPAGLTSLPSSGAISFTPTTAATYTFTVQVTDSANNTATQAVTLTVMPAPPVITSTTLPNASVGVAYSQQLTDSYGGTPTSTTWAITGGGSSLTAVGLAMNASGLISGTTPSSGNASFTVTVTVNSQVSAPVTLSLAVTANPAVTTSTLPPAYVGTAYSQTLTASGGSGTGYTWSVTSGQSTLTTLGLSLAPSTGVLSGTPGTTGSGPVTFQVTDSNSHTGSVTLTVSAYAALALPAANPSSLPAASTNAGYGGTIAATGGAPGSYTWTINGSPIATDGSNVTLSNGLGLTVSSNGSSTLAVGGTPTSNGTVSFTAAVKDSAGATAGPVTYTITVSTTYSVSGQITLANSCTGGGVAGVTVSINTSPVQTTTTDNNGNFTFAGLKNGTYTLTPSLTGTSAAFLPATQSVTVNGTNPGSVAFGASLGYTVSGTAAYSGSNTGRIYVTLSSNNCSGFGSPGTSIPAGGTFTIQGVAPGTYTLTAYMDTQGTGAANAADPTGTTGSVAVSADTTGVDVTLADPSAVTLTTAPKLKVVAPMNSGVMISYKPITDNSGNELATSYTVQWSTTSSFTTVAGSQTFPATGDHGAEIWGLNSATDSSLTNGSVYYFRVYGTAGSSQSQYGVYLDTNNNPLAVTIGAPSGGNTITGSVTFSGTATGPMYAGFYDLNTGDIYAQYIASPVSPQPISIQVPSGSDYFQFATVDNNNNGAIDTGDFTNTNGNNITGVAISSSGTSNLTLPSANSTAVVTTSNFQSTSSGGTSQSYSLTFKVELGTKLPVAVDLTSGPNLALPIDIGECSNCGKPFQITFGLGAVVPTAGDAYSLKVTYSDGTSETLTATVTAVVNVFATNMVPGVSSSAGTTPTFSWTDPANASSYTYSFSLMDSSFNTIWQIPGQNSNANAFASTITSITWGTDPTGGGSTPTVGTLTTGTTYYWQIQAIDSNGNSSTQQVSFKP
jgi:hypothetical protein